MVQTVSLEVVIAQQIVDLFSEIKETICAEAQHHECNFLEQIISLLVETSCQLVLQFQSRTKENYG